MAAISPDAVMLGNPQSVLHQPSAIELARLLNVIQSQAAAGGLAYVDGNKSDLLARTGVSDGEFALVLTGDDDGGVYERVSGAWERNATIPAIFIESIAAANAEASAVAAALSETRAATSEANTSASEGAAAVSASVAAIYAGQAIAAAQLAGTPLYPDTTTALAAVDEGASFLVSDAGGLVSYTKTGGVAADAKRIGEVIFDDADAVLDFNGPMADGVIIRTRNGNYAAVAVSSGAHFTNAGGQGFRRIYNAATGAVIRSDGTIDLYLTGVSGTFTVGETVTGGTSGVTATVSAVVDDVVTLTGASGFFTHPYSGVTATETVIGGTSGASGITDRVDYWRYISDVEHEPFGFDSIDTNITEQYAVTIHRSQTASKRVASVVTVDETLARVGLMCGPSVNDSDIRIHMSAPLTGRFAASSSPSVTDVSSFHKSHTSVSWDSTAKEFIVSHLDCGLTGQMQCTYEYTAKDEVVDIAVRRVSGTQHRVAVYDTMMGSIQWNGSTWTINNREISRNGSQTGYSVGAMSGGPDYLFTVSHPALATEYGDWPVSLTIIGKASKYVAFTTNVTRTSFDVQLWDLTTGSVVTALPSSLKIGFVRGKYRLPRPITGHIAFSLPNVRVDPRDVVVSTGNLWALSVERYGDGAGDLL